jgi:voltage-gated potassium channel
MERVVQVELSDESLRRRAYKQLEPRAWGRIGLSPINKCLVVLILLATLAGILETEPEVESRFGTSLRTAEIGFGILFLIEYLTRLWTVAEEAGDRPPWRCRLRFVFSFWALIDLAALLSALLPFLALNGSVLRFARLIRIARLAKLGRMSSAMEHLIAAARLVRDELVLILALAAGVLLVAATALYALESELQPDKFGSVPRAMWWAIVTMTTIGYGDAFPVSPAGKMAAALLALVGVGLIALPAGLMAGALSQVMRKPRDGDE